MDKIIWIDTDTNEKVEFAVEEQTTLNGTNYLLVSEGEGDEADAYIMKEIQTDGEETVYEMVEDDNEFDAIAKVFSELLDEDTDLKY